MEQSDTKNTENIGKQDSKDARKQWREFRFFFFCDGEMMSPGNLEHFQTALRHASEQSIRPHGIVSIKAQKQKRQTKARSPRVVAASLGIVESSSGSGGAKASRKQCHLMTGRVLRPSGFILLQRGQQNGSHGFSRPIRRVMNRCGNGGSVTAAQ